MNILCLTLLYPPEEVDSVSRLSRDGLQNQINAFQWALIHGVLDGGTETYDGQSADHTH